MCVCVCERRNPHKIAMPRTNPKTKIKERTKGKFERRQTKKRTITACDAIKTLTCGIHVLWHKDNLINRSSLKPQVLEFLLFKRKFKVKADEWEPRVESELASLRSESKIKQLFHSFPLTNITYFSPSPSYTTTFVMRDERWEMSSVCHT